MVKRIFRLTIFLVALCFAARAAEPQWPEAILALERMALENPRPGAAWSQLRSFTHMQRLEAEWRERWESHITDDSGAAESLLLGWLEAEAGDTAAARKRFERATAIAPRSHHAWVALAEMQLRAGDPAGEASARKAVEFATTVAQRMEAWRLAPRIAQQRGELAKAWAAWKAIEAEPLSLEVRLALVPDFARMHLATGDVAEWMGRLTEARGEAGGPAVEAAAVLALDDAALAYRLASEALAKDGTNGPLLKLAIASAQKAGFAGEAANRVDVALGETPDDEALFDALLLFARLDAPEHALRLCRRHAAQLAPMATRWRELLPALWRLGVAPEMREIFARQEARGGWELALALAEMAILEKDYPAAVEPLWRVLAAEYDADELASMMRVIGNTPGGLPSALIPLRGYSLTQRLGQIRTQLEGTPRVFAPANPNSQGWAVYSLCDGRDLVLAYLLRLTKIEDAEALGKFLERLRKATAHWPVEERVLAATIMGDPAGLMDAADEVSKLESPAVSLISFTRAQLLSVRLIPNLSGDVSERVTKMLADFPKPPATTRKLPSEVRGWRSSLQLCWQLFCDGRFVDADRMFQGTLNGIASQSFGPSEQDWTRFHTATINSVGAFEDQKKAMEAAGCALRWLALQTPRRADWPAPPKPGGLWKETNATPRLLPLFTSPKQNQYNAYSPSRFHNFATVGGGLPGDLWAPLFFLAIRMERLGKAGELPMETAGWPLECERVLLMATMTTAIFLNESPPTASLERIFDTPDGTVARYLAQLAEMNGRAEGSKQELKRDLISDTAPAGAVGHGAALVTSLNVFGRQRTVEELTSLVNEISQQPLATQNYAGARKALEAMLYERGGEKPAIEALISKLSIGWLRSVPAEVAPSEAEMRLRALVDGADADKAVELAKSVLAWPMVRLARSNALSAPQKEALKALNVCGELPGWFSELSKKARSGAEADWERVARYGALILEIIPAIPPAPHPGAPDEERAGRGEKLDRLTLAFRRDVLATQTEAQLALVRLQPDDARLWDRLSEMRTDTKVPWPKEGASEVDTLLSGAERGLGVNIALKVLGADLDRLAEIAKRWPVAHRPILNTEPNQAALSLAQRLWDGGKREVAIQWLQRLFAANPGEHGNELPVRAALLEALAAEGDREELTRVLAQALCGTLKPIGELCTFPPRDPNLELDIRWPPVVPVLKQVTDLGLEKEVLAALAKEPDPSAARAALMLRLHLRDLSARAELAQWLEHSPPTQILEETGQLLAPWPEARLELETVLNILEPAHARIAPGDRMKQLTRHALLAAKGGITDEARARINGVQEAQREMAPAGRRNLFEVLEVLTTPAEQPGAAEVADQIAFAAKAQRQPEKTFVEGLQRFHVDGPFDAARLLGKALGRHVSFREASSRDALITSGHVLAAQANQWGDFIPHMWLKAVHEDGTVEAGWALGWFTVNGENKVFHTPDLSRNPLAKPMKVELFYGRTNDRLERFAVAEEAASAGVWRGPLAVSDGFLNASITVDERTFLGSPAPVTDGKNFFPSTREKMMKLPPLVWSRQAGGPEGEFWRGLSFGRSANEQSFAAASFELPSLTPQDLRISGWIKGGRFTVNLVTPGGKRSTVYSFEGNPTVWTRISWKVPAQLLMEGKINLGDDARCFYTLAPGGEYTEFGVNTLPAGPEK